MSSKKYRNKLCVYCRTANSATADHVFPKEMFQLRHRNNIPKVPACKKCNNEKSKIEHYLLSVLPFGGTHDDAKEMLSIDALKRLKKNQKLFSRLRNEWGHSYIPRESKVLEKRMHVKFDPNMLHTFIGFASLGLTYHHWGLILPRDYEIRAFTPSITGMRFIERLFDLRAEHTANEVLGNNTVRYKGACSGNQESLSVWAVQLLGGMTVATENHGHIFKNSYVAVISGTPNIFKGLNFS